MPRANSRLYRATMALLIIGFSLMGLTFGGLHLSCGFYLYFTERKPAS